MKIAVDARELAGHPTGVGRYLRELLTEWSGSPAALRHEWTLYTPQPLEVPSPFIAGSRIVAGRAGTLWEQWHFPRALAARRPDVLFAPGYTAPLGRVCPMVLTVHDVSFAAHPEWFTYREGARRRTLTRLSAARADVVLTDTAFSCDEIVSHFNVPRERIRVIPLGVRVSSPTRAALPATASPARHPIVLFVGSIFARRHVDAVIEGFTRHVAPRVPESRLEIVGENRSYPRIDLERVVAQQPPDVQPRIQIRSYVDDDTVRELYGRASVFAFPSEYEGFGFTPLEALAAGVAPVVLDTAVAREVYGAAARYVPHTEPLGDALGDAMAELLSDDSRRRELLDRAPAVLARYRWAQTAAATLTVLEEAGRV
jgi:glycosyltransferase involved in cell wall biosynthesis